MNKTFYIVALLFFGPFAYHSITAHGHGGSFGAGFGGGLLGGFLGGAIVSSGSNHSDREAARASREEQEYWRSKREQLEEERALKEQQHRHVNTQKENIESDTENGY